MARKRLEPAPVPVLETPEDAFLVQPTEEEAEADRVHDLLTSIAGEQGRGLILYCFRAAEKNKSRPNEFLKIYPTDIVEPDLLMDLQENFGEGNYVFLSKYPNGQIHKKGLVSVGASKEHKPPSSPPPAGAIQYDKHLERLTATAEKRLVLDKLEQIAEGKDRAGGSEATSIMALVMKMTMETNNTLMRILLERDKQPVPKTPVSEMMDIFKMGLNMGQGKPLDDSEESLTDSVLKALPSIVEMLKGSQAARRPVAPGRGLPPPPPPAPAVSGPAPPEAIGATAMGRIIGEIAFCLEQPETSRIYSHIAEYTENYLPGSIDEILAQSEDEYVSFVLKLHPAFPSRESFFRNLYRFVKAEYGEPERCATCAGAKMVRTDHGTLTQCPDCKGSGEKTPEGGDEGTDG